MNPQSQELKEYIQNSLSNGASEYDIRTTLLNAHWPEVMIDEAFHMILPSQAGTINHQELEKTQEYEGVNKWPKKRKIFLALATVLLIAVVGLVVYQAVDRSSNEIAPETASYAPPSIPADWVTSSVPYNGNNYTFSHPSDWKVISQSNETLGSYSDMRIVTADYSDVASTDDFARKGLVRTGAMFDINVTSYSGSLESYKKNVETKNFEDENAIFIAGGYEDLKTGPILGRPTLSYTQKVNWNRTVIIKQNESVVKIDYFQPYEVSTPSQRPDLKDEHIEQLHLLVASVTRS